MVKFKFITQIHHQLQHALGEEQFLQWVVSDCQGSRQAFAALMEKSFRFNAKSVHSV